MAHIITTSRRIAAILCLLAVCHGLTGCIEFAFEGGMADGLATGDAVALSRLGAVPAEGLTLEESSVLNTAARARIPGGAIGFVGVAPVAEEMAIMRASSRIISFPTTYKMGAGAEFRITDGAKTIATFTRTGVSLVVSNAKGEVVGESVIADNRVLHYTDPTRKTLRGYTEINGQTHEQWIYDDAQNPVHYATETVEPLPEKAIKNPYVIPAELLLAAQDHHPPQPYFVEYQPTITFPEGVVPAAGPGVYTSGNQPPGSIYLSHSPTSYHLAGDGSIFRIFVNAKSKVVWSNGNIRVWADRGSPHLDGPLTARVYPHSMVICAQSTDGNSYMFYVAAVP